MKNTLIKNASKCRHVTPVRKKIDLVRIGSLYPDQLKAFPSISYIYDTGNKVSCKPSSSQKFFSVFKEPDKEIQNGPPKFITTIRHDLQSGP